MSKLQKTLLSISCLAGLVLVGTAGAVSGPTTRIVLRPNKAGKNSTLTVSGSGYASPVPTSAELLVQKGFKASRKSVSKLCNRSASSCPVQSKIGSGTAQVSFRYLGLTGTVPVNFKLYLGTPRQAGDIASVIVVGSASYAGTSYSARGSGRLFKSSTGLELLVDQFPAVHGLPSGISLTLDSLSFSAGASRTVKGKTYSLITNPLTCRGAWTGLAIFTFADGRTLSQSLSTACRK